MEVIRATIENLDQVAPLFNGYRIFYKQPSDLEAARKFLTARFNKKDSEIFLALDDQGNGLGFTQLYPSFSSVKMQRVYILNDLFVAEKARGQGVGEAIMERAKQFARDEKCRGLTLETESDNPARKLYERLGWKEDTFPHYTWEI